MSPFEIIFWVMFALALLILLIVALICFVEIIHHEQGKWTAIWTLIGVVAIILFAILYVWGATQKGVARCTDEIADARGICYGEPV